VSKKCALKFALTLIIYRYIKNIRASTMETPIFRFLNKSHVYTSLIYNFLILVLNRNSIPKKDSPQWGT